MAAERSELTPEEAALLTDPQALARAREHGPVRLADRNVNGLKIPAITFELVTFDNVSLFQVEFLGNAVSQHGVPGRDVSTGRRYSISAAL